MKKNLTVYKNELNTIPFRKFNSVEMDLFFSICSKMRNKGLSEVRYSFEDLKSISKYSSRETGRFLSDLENVYKKMTQLSYREENEDKIGYFILFTGYEINKKNKYVDISVNPKLQYILNEISESFTKFELEEFTDLRSSYAKTTFRLLKQFRQTGYWKISIVEFRNLLDVPESYRMTALDDRVISPIKKELSPIFKDLQINKISAKKSRKIEYIEFRFKAEDDMNARNEKTFRNDKGEYYQKDLFHLTKEEEKKTFPTIEQN